MGFQSVYQDPEDGSASQEYAMNKKLIELSDRIAKIAYELEVFGIETPAVTLDEYVSVVAAESPQIKGTEIHYKGHYVSLRSSHMVDSSDKVYANLYRHSNEDGQSLASAKFDLGTGKFSDFSGSAGGQDVLSEIATSLSSSDKRKLASEWKKFNKTSTLDEYVNAVAFERYAAETGPRGGKIIGKTRSGKPIYDTKDHPAHKDFSAD